MRAGPGPLQDLATAWGRLDARTSEDRGGQGRGFEHPARDREDQIDVDRTRMLELEQKYAFQSLLLGKQVLHDALCEKCCQKTIPTNHSSTTHSSYCPLATTSSILALRPHHLLLLSVMSLSPDLPHASTHLAYRHTLQSMMWSAVAVMYDVV